MRNATDLDRPVPLEQAAPGIACTCSDTPVVVFQRASAGNDAACEDPAFPVGPTSYEMQQAARARRAFVLRGIIAAAIRAAGAFARWVLARHRQRLKARAIYDALHQLDDRTLRDLGFDRSEIRSVAAEATGEAERTRVRVLLLAHDLS